MTEVQINVFNGRNNATKRGDSPLTTKGRLDIFFKKS